jgi:hypothetical protein
MAKMCLPKTAYRKIIAIATAKKIIIQTPGAMSIQEGLGLLAMTSLTQVIGASIFWFPAIHFATPLAIPSIPSVTINGTSRNEVMSAPFAKPTTPPVKTPQRRANTGENPAFMAKAVITLARAILEAADRSIPPLMMSGYAFQVRDS